METEIGSQGRKESGLLLDFVSRTATCAVVEARAGEPTRVLGQVLRDPGLTLSCTACMFRHGFNTFEVLSCCLLDGRQFVSRSLFSPQSQLQQCVPHVCKIKCAQSGLQQNICVRFLLAAKASEDKFFILGLFVQCDDAAFMVLFFCVSPGVSFDNRVEGDSCFDSIVVARNLKLIFDTVTHYVPHCSSSPL